RQEGHPQGRQEEGRQEEGRQEGHPQGRQEEGRQEGRQASGEEDRQEGGQEAPREEGRQEGGEEASCEEGGQEEACQEGRQEGSTTGQARQEGACRGNPGGSCADDVITRSPINRHQAPFPHAQAEREFFYAPAEAGGWCRSPGAGARPGVEASARVRVRRRG